VSSLEEVISNLTIENERIKKTSKQRFKKNKKLENQVKRLTVLESRFKVLEEFLHDNGIAITCYSGEKRIDFSVINAIKGLKSVGVNHSSPPVNGLYAVKTNGKYRLAKIKHSICWNISLGCEEEFKPLHFLDIDSLILIEADA